MKIVNSCLMRNKKAKVLKYLIIVSMIIIMLSYGFNYINSTSEDDVKISSEIVMVNDDGQELMNIDIKWTWSKKVFLKRNTDFIGIVAPKGYVRETVKEEKDAMFGHSMGDLHANLVFQEGNQFLTNYLSTADNSGHISLVYRREEGNTENIAEMKDMAVYYVHDQSNLLSKPSLWIKKENLYEKITSNVRE